MAPRDPLMTVDTRLVAAMRDQLARRPVGAARVGWKYGSGDAERIGDEIAVGHLTAATTLADGATYSAGGGDLHADAELAVEVGEPRRYAAALEICDVGRRGTPEEVVATNVFHRAVAFGPFVAALPPALAGALVVNGERRDSAPAPTDVEQRLAAVARALAAVDEELQPGDRVITGLIVQVPVSSGDDVVADLGPLGSVRLSIA